MVKEIERDIRKKQSQKNNPLEFTIPFLPQCFQLQQTFSINQQQLLDTPLSCAFWT